MVSTLIEERGWVCPTCGRSLSPSVIVCPFCVATTTPPVQMPASIPYINATDLGRPDCCKGCSSWPGPCFCAKPSMSQSSGISWRLGDQPHEGVSYGGVFSSNVGLSSSSAVDWKAMSLGNQTLGNQTLGYVSVGGLTSGE